MERVGKNLSWFAIAGIDALIAIALIACVVHSIWSDEYREKWVIQEGSVNYGKNGGLYVWVFVPTYCGDGFVRPGAQSYNWYIVSNGLVAHYSLNSSIWAVFSSRFFVVFLLEESQNFITFNLLK